MVLKEQAGSNACWLSGEPLGNKWPDFENDDSVVSLLGKDSKGITRYVNTDGFMQR